MTFSVLKLERSTDVSEVQYWNILAIFTNLCVLNEEMSIEVNL